MKKCPFCAEEIQDDAIKCKHCGEFLDGAYPQSEKKEKLPWWFRTSTIVIAVLCVGPFALPLLWWRPKTSLAWKIIWSIVILVLTWLMVRVTAISMETIKEYYQMLEDL